MVGEHHEEEVMDVSEVAKEIQTARGNNARREILREDQEDEE